MARSVTVEKSLKRLLGLCPDITLTSSDIQLIIDGKMNEIITKHKGTFVAPVLINTDDGGAIAIDTQEATTETSDKSFDEYFMTTKQED